MSNIREMLPKEYGLLDTFLHEAIYTAPEEPRPPRSETSKPNLRIYVEEFGREGDTAICAETDGQIVGAAWSRLMHGYGFIDDAVPEIAVSVLPEHRGQGIGTALLMELVRRCARRGFPALSLSVQRANPAIRLYKRLGFHEVTGDEDEAVMVLPLNTTSAGAAIDSTFSDAHSANEA